jgi:hypothetical protein
MAKIFRPILQACGVTLDIVCETCRLDSQVQHVLVDGASNIEVATANDNRNPAAREADQNSDMFYIL